MRYCIRCNPRSELVMDEEGQEVCRFHGKNFTLEVAPALGEQAPAEVEAPAEVVVEEQVEEVSE